VTASASFRVNTDDHAGDSKTEDFEADNILPWTFSITGALTNIPPTTGLASRRTAIRPITPSSDPIRVRRAPASPLRRR
jgi:hypothetical protein